VAPTEKLVEILGPERLKDPKESPIILFVFDKIANLDSGNLDILRYAVCYRASRTFQFRPNSLQKPTVEFFASSSNRIRSVHTREEL
jgi:hypothetical protein